MKATIQAGFMYGEKQRGELPEETCQIRWGKLMNVLLPERHNKKVVDMINFVHNEHDIINRNMPFMFQKLDKQQKREGPGKLKGSKMVQFQGANMDEPSNNSAEDA